MEAGGTKEWDTVASETRWFHMVHPQTCIASLVWGERSAHNLWACFVKAAAALLSRPQTNELFVLQPFLNSSRLKDYVIDLGLLVIYVWDGSTAEGLESVEREELITFSTTSQCSWEKRFTPSTAEAILPSLAAAGFLIPKGGWSYQVCNFSH